MFSPDDAPDRNSCGSHRGQMTSAVVPSGTERVACIFLPLRFSDTSILPKCVSTVAEASVKVPIWGQTLKGTKTWRGRFYTAHFLTQQRKRATTPCMVDRTTSETVRTDSPSFEQGRIFR